MRWKHALRDYLPATSGPVLLCLNGVYYIAFFNKELQEFKITDDDTERAVPPTEEGLYWIETEES